MPYRDDSYTKYVYPLKLHEYLASGRPVVGTGILTLQALKGIISLVNTVNEWSTALAEALKPAANTDDRRKERQAIARQHDWGVIIAQMSLTIAERLGEEFASQLNSFPVHVENVRIGNKI